MPRAAWEIRRDWDRLYHKLWQKGLRQALLDGRVTLSHEVNGRRVMLDPQRYRDLAIIPPAPIGEQEPILLLNGQMLSNVLFHETG